ncbi:hypothetical protein QYE76_014552 [Lolium multiflorum]|uniref:Uncharacterized protein n=1 Tax=Lolium multiflorum TaxID=4521 RepID=A0AAD8U0W6_LOLMU|nr:hypothetical protein QYE76_014552 [Lolium multiflorum]
MIWAATHDLGGSLMTSTARGGEDGHWRWNCNRCSADTEGIFHINAENSQEEFVRDQLNSGTVPDGIDVHSLAGLIKMDDPLTAVMYAVQVMNFLKMLIQKTLKDREESNLEDASLPQKDPSDENGHQNPSFPVNSQPEELSGRSSFVTEEPLLLLVN